MNKENQSSKLNFPDTTWNCNDRFSPSLVAEIWFWFYSLRPCCATTIEHVAVTLTAKMTQINNANAIHISTSLGFSSFHTKGGTMESTRSSSDDVLSGDGWIEKRKIIEVFRHFVFREEMGNMNLKKKVIFELFDVIDILTSLWPVGGQAVPFLPFQNSTIKQTNYGHFLEIRCCCERLDWHVNYSTHKFEPRSTKK